MDASGYQHILRRIIELSDTDGLLAFRRVSRGTRTEADRWLYRHLVIKYTRPLTRLLDSAPLPLVTLLDPSGRGLPSRASWLALPSVVPDAWSDNATLRRILSYAKVIDNVLPPSPSRQPGQGHAANIVMQSRRVSPSTVRVADWPSPTVGLGTRPPSPRTLATCSGGTAVYMCPLGPGPQVEPGMADVADGLVAEVGTEVSGAQKHVFNLLYPSSSPSSLAGADFGLSWFHPAPGVSEFVVHLTQDASFTASFAYIIPPYRALGVLSSLVELAARYPTTKLRVVGLERMPRLAVPLTSESSWFDQDTTPIGEDWLPGIAAELAQHVAWYIHPDDEPDGTEEASVQVECLTAEEYAAMVGEEQFLIETMPPLRKTKTEHTSSHALRSGTLDPGRG